MSKRYPEITKYCPTGDSILIEYDMCATLRTAYKSMEAEGKVEYLGTGFIAEINGHKQALMGECHFWRRKSVKVINN